ncbi:MAG TPA: hypothetical protein PLA85_07015 [Micropepsaceae bacterium]|nr:hypothetical protein [Micropepsaceae bacterium]
MAFVEASAQAFALVILLIEDHVSFKGVRLSLTTPELANNAGFPGRRQLRIHGVPQIVDVSRRRQPKLSQKTLR